jgi:hypothetical protein
MTLRSCAATPSDPQFAVDVGRGVQTVYQTDPGQPPSGPLGALEQDLVLFVSDRWASHRFIAVRVGSPTPRSRWRGSAPRLPRSEQHLPEERDV